MDTTHHPIFMVFLPGVKLSPWENKEEVTVGDIRPWIAGRTG
jgi:hypothetical protein